VDSALGRFFNDLFTRLAGQERHPQIVPLEVSSVPMVGLRILANQLDASVVLAIVEQRQPRRCLPIPGIHRSLLQLGPRLPLRKVIPLPHPVAQITLHPREERGRQVFLSFP
jgi:hypothetical protein